MLDYIRKAMLAGMGLAVMSTEKLQAFLDELVKKGEMSEKEAREAYTDLQEKSRQMSQEFREKSEKVFRDLVERLNVPSRREFDELKARVAELEKRSSGGE